MSEFFSGLSGAIGGAAEWTGTQLAGGVEFFGDISAGIAGVGRDVYEAGRDIIGETSREAGRTAADLAEEAVVGQAAQVPIWIWLAGGYVLGIVTGLLPNPFKK